MNLQAIFDFIATNAISMLVRIAVAIVIWVVGRWVIGLVMSAITRALARGGRIDATLSRYITSILSAILTIGLGLGILGYLGVETTSFAALLAGAGLAIGTAWGGLLAHLAAGVFMQMMRPFKVGDYVSAAGVEGTVNEMGLFGTTVLTPDNVTTVIGNNRIFSDIIRNYSTQPYRRVDAVAKVANTVDPKEAIERLRAVIPRIPNVLPTPAPDIEILDFSAEGPRLCVRPYCHTDHYWQVYFDVNRAIVETFTAAGYPVPATPLLTHAQ